MEMIEKQAAIDIAKDLLIQMDEYHQYNQAINNYCAELGKLPSVQPEILACGSGELKVQPKVDEWCTDCPAYDHEKHNCPRFNRVIRRTVQEIKGDITAEQAVEKIRDYLKRMEKSERLKGHWIDTGSGQECSECGEVQHGYDSFRYYCAKCGSDNRR